ncbi:hypothetical protein EYC80_001175 [Monilinia laxa]|uniref:Uncharacterized protein n=1 Tax=Monilinia laxa TaxID=61186 RepID=A0A5N6K8D0_MONLA|nr:hypothetical protein EYC80_001175 [Monilinia laxa]
MQIWVRWVNGFAILMGRLGCTYVRLWKPTNMHAALYFNSYSRFFLCYFAMTISIWKDGRLSEVLELLPEDVYNWSVFRLGIVRSVMS